MTRGIMIIISLLLTNFLVLIFMCSRIASNKILCTNIYSTNSSRVTTNNNRYNSFHKT